jgi:hypothetical protein
MRQKQVSTCSHDHVLTARGVRDESGDGAIVEVLRYLWEEEAPQVVRLVICYNHPAGRNGAAKEMVRKWRLGSGVEEVLAEEPLNDCQGQVVGMMRQVEKAAFLEYPPVLVECGSL